MVCVYGLESKRIVFSSDLPDIIDVCVFHLLPCLYNKWQGEEVRNPGHNNITQPTIIKLLSLIIATVLCSPFGPQMDSQTYRASQKVHLSMSNMDF